MSCGSFLSSLTRVPSALLKHPISFHAKVHSYKQYVKYRRKGLVLSVTFTLIHAFPSPLSYPFAHRAHLTSVDRSAWPVSM